MLSCGRFARAIHAHLLIDAALVQHVVPIETFSDEEVEEMKEMIQYVKEKKLGSVFDSRI